MTITKAVRFRFHFPDQMHSKFQLVNTLHQEFLAQPPAKVSSPRLQMICRVRKKL